MCSLNIQNDFNAVEMTDSTLVNNSSDEDGENVLIRRKRTPRILISDDENSNSAICNEKIAYKQELIGNLPSGSDSDSTSPRVADRSSSKCGEEPERSSSDEAPTVPSTQSYHNSPDKELQFNLTNEQKKIVKKRSKVDIKLKIASETQRFEREKSLSLPYHRPKQRTLKEFLSRKKSYALKKDSLRLTSTTMLSVWKEIDTSTKEAVEFFKSESDDDEWNTKAEEKPDSSSTECCLVDLEKNKMECPEELFGDFVENKLISCRITNDKDNAKNNACDNLSITLNSGLQSDIYKESTSKIIANVTENTEVDNANVPLSIGSDLQADVNKITTAIFENLPERIESDKVMPAADRTSSWLDGVIEFEKKEKKLRKFFNPSILAKVPTLSIDDDFVELDQSKPTQLKAGAMQLMDRLLRTRRPKTPEQIHFTSSGVELDISTGELKGVSTEIIHLPTAKDEAVEFSKPGQKFQKLKQKLRNDIESKWEEENKKRQIETTLNNKEHFEEVAAVDELLDDDSESIAETESEPEENDICISDKPRKICEFGDSEAEESENDADDEGLDDNDDNSEDDDINELGYPQALGQKTHDPEEIDCSLPAFQPGGGLLMGGSALTQMTQPLPFAQFSPLSSPAISHVTTPRTPQTKFSRGVAECTPRTIPKQVYSAGPKKNLFASENSQETKQLSNLEDTDDPFMFVSGAFPENTPAKDQNEAENTQTKLKRIILQDSDDSQSVPIAEGTAEEYSVTPNKTENDEDKETEDGIRMTRKKNMTHLKFSDDDDSEAEKEEDSAESATDSENKENEVDDVEYDSEENEMPTAKPNDFFDQEAELSESEWSGDEDEQGLDKLEAEAGDADILDEEQVASQLGRIHMRRLLDDDARDVRLLQELLFEDGDLHGDGKARDRKFRWKNITGFDLLGRKEGEEGSDGEEGEDAEQAKIRHERAQFFHQLEQENNLDDAEDKLESNKLITNYGRNLTKGFKPKPLTANMKYSNTRGSFLCKDGSFLTRLTKVTTSATDGPLGPAHSRNFVFAAKEKVDTAQAVSVHTENGKRKAAECAETVKRSKLAVSDRPSLLDQLE